MKMIFDTKQPSVSVTVLPNEMRDITVLTNEEEIKVSNDEFENEYTAFRYEGNQFRTIYNLEKEEIEADLDKYLAYSTNDEPTPEQLAHDEQIIDEYTLQLMEEGML